MVINPGPWPSADTDLSPPHTRMVVCVVLAGGVSHSWVGGSHLWRGMSCMCACARAQHGHLQTWHTHPLSKSSLDSNFSPTWIRSSSEGTYMASAELPLCLVGAGSHLPPKHPHIQKGISLPARQFSPSGIWRHWGFCVTVLATVENVELFFCCKMVVFTRIYSYIQAGILTAQQELFVQSDSMHGSK